MSDSSRLLLVDDDPRVLEGLDNLLFDRIGEWELVSAVGGGSAIARLASHERFEVLITDMRMPVVDGLEVLRYAAAHRPEVMRIVLSGQAELDKAMQALAIGHQYLAKPCDETTLVAAIERSLRLQRAVVDRELRAKAGRLDDAPPHAAVLSEIGLALAAPRASIDAVAQIAARDVGLVARLLRVASWCSRGTGQVSSLTAAIHRIGLDGVTALTAALASAEPPLDLDRELRDRSNHHALQLASLAGALCDDAETAELASLCGLMHGLGALALATHVPTRLRHCHATSAPPQHAIDRERRALSIDHAELGAQILEFWQLTELAQVIRYHHRPSGLPLDVEWQSPLTALHLADAALGEGDADLDHRFVRSLGSAGEAAWSRAQRLGQELR
jgi:HD-like signal output (HDOD) protein/CheY-like chemotaxis protein